MIKKKTFLALIPARGGSKEVKFKNIRKIKKNKTLLDLAYTFANKCIFIDKVIVSTDHRKIINQCKKKKYNYIVRPKSLSKDYVSAYRVIENAVSSDQMELADEQK